MKTIKIKICNFDPNDHCSYGYYFVNILKKHYKIEFSEKPDYVFYNESSYEHLNYDCIKIFYTGENITPNFNLCDYAIGFDYVEFGDRYFRLPIYLVANFYRESEIDQNKNQTQDKKEFTVEDLNNKSEFCSFVYSNYLGDNSRKEFFEKLSEYKKVNAGGAYLNNIGGKVSNKLAFEQKHKFSIAFENSSREGYTTEKITTAFIANTIPIYWGNPKIGLEFNEGRFINCHNYPDLDSVIERVKEIDKDDALYLKMINEPIYSGFNPAEVESNFEKFLTNIFDQEIEKAERKTINAMRAKELILNERIVAKATNRRNLIRKAAASIYRPFKKIGAIEKIKHMIISSIKNSK